MDHSPFVGVLERVGDRPGDPEHLLERQLAFADESLAERLPFDVGRTQYKVPPASPEWMRVTMWGC
jgi:hypothetical protein